MAIEQNQKEKITCDDIASAYTIHLILGDQE
jgi:hypothetical protein